jgi:hypothetical protein
MAVGLTLALASYNCNPHFVPSPNVLTLHGMAVGLTLAAATL